MADIQVVTFSGFGSEISGPGPALVALTRDVSAALVTPVIPWLKPYSVLGGLLGGLGNLNEFLALAMDCRNRNRRMVFIGHSFGYAAVKWLMDRYLERGVPADLIAACVSLDGVPNTDRFGEFFPSQAADDHPEKRWHCQLAGHVLCIYQRHQIFPQGTQVAPVSEDQEVVNLCVTRGEVPGADPTDDHCGLVSDAAVVQYVCEFVSAACKKE